MNVQLNGAKCCDLCASKAAVCVPKCGDCFCFACLKKLRSTTEDGLQVCCSSCLQTIESFFDVTRKPSRKGNNVNILPTEVPPSKTVEVLVSYSDKNIGVPISVKTKLSGYDGLYKNENSAAYDSGLDESASSGSLSGEGDQRAEDSDVGDKEEQCFLKCQTQVERSHGDELIESFNLGFKELEAVKRDLERVLSGEEGNAEGAEVDSLSGTVPPSDPDNSSDNGAYLADDHSHHASDQGDHRPLKPPADEDAPFAGDQVADKTAVLPGISQILEESEKQHSYVGGSTRVQPVRSVPSGLPYADSGSILNYAANDMSFDHGGSQRGYGSEPPNDSELTTFMVSQPTPNHYQGSELKERNLNVANQFRRPQQQTSNHAVRGNQSYPTTTTAQQPIDENSMM